MLSFLFSGDIMPVKQTMLGELNARTIPNGSTDTGVQC